MVNVYEKNSHEGVEKHSFEMPENFHNSALKETIINNETCLQKALLESG